MKNIISRFLKRIRFRKTITIDESNNVVDGMVKAQRLYKELSKIAHPDRNIGNEDVAEDIMSRIVANKHNYKVLLDIQEEIREKLH
ncbi:MAG: hypothetical protein IJN35_00690 [Muribaculaceae bacterium]|nr:hypothetical protein [Muribaculaceae bacterium]